MPDMFDLYVAFGLIVLVVVVYLGNRVGVLPKKSVPILLGALAGALGLAFFRRWQARASDSQIAELKRRIDARDHELTRLESQRKLSHDELAAARARLDLQLMAAQKQRMDILADSEAKKREIEAASPDRTSELYYQMLAEEAAREARQKPATVAAGGGN